MPKASPPFGTGLHEQAVPLVPPSGERMSEIATDLGTCYDTLRTCVNRRSATRSRAPTLPARRQRSATNSARLPVRTRSFVRNARACDERPSWFLARARRAVPLRMSKQGAPFRGTATAGRTVLERWNGPMREGVTVLDLSRIQAGLYATQLLARPGRPPDHGGEPPRRRHAPLGPTRSRAGR